MDEFLNNNLEKESEATEDTQILATEAQKEEPQQEAVDIEENNTETVFEEQYTSENKEEYTPVYNPVQYSEVKPVADYKPMSKGLKVFALIMAAVILLTGACLTGYYIGKNSISAGLSSRPVSKADLAARPTDSDEMTEAQVYEKVNKSVVGIVVYNSSGEGTQASGVVYSKDGYIVTNDHIYSEIPSAKFKIYAYDGSEYDADFVAGDKVSDLAVLKVKGAKLTPAEFGNSDDIFHGEHVVAIGRPSDATDASSITRGVISATSRRVQTTTSYSARLIQTDSAINPGSSGGALVNMYGQTIGITSSKLASTEYDAVGYAIPTTQMKRIVDELLDKGRVESRAKLGISYNAIDSVTAEIKGYDYVGLYLAEIDEESGLYSKAEKGDVITHINGVAITNDDIVLDIIEQKRAGDTIELTIVGSDSSSKTVKVVLKANISESSYIEKEIDLGADNGQSSGNNETFDFPFGE